MSVRTHMTTGTGALYAGDMLIATAHYVITETTNWTVPSHATDRVSRQIEGFTEWSGRLTDVSETLPRVDGFRLRLADDREGDILLQRPANDGSTFRGVGALRPSPSLPA